jgi:hypothetical protein
MFARKQAQIKKPSKTKIVQGIIIRREVSIGGRKVECFFNKVTG